MYEFPHKKKSLLHHYFSRTYDVSQIIYWFQCIGVTIGLQHFNILGYHRIAILQYIANYLFLQRTLTANAIANSEACPAGSEALAAGSEGQGPPCWLQAWKGPQASNGLQVGIKDLLFGFKAIPSGSKALWADWKALPAWPEALPTGFETLPAGYVTIIDLYRAAAPLLIT